MRLSLSLAFAGALAAPAFAGALMGVATGCGETPPPKAQTPPPANRAPETVSPAPIAHSSPSASTVAISDEIRARCGVSDQDAYFAFDSARLTLQDRTPLDSVARCFASGPLKGHQVKLIGRADPRGEGEYNMTLGQSRVDALGQYLLARGMSRPMTLTTSRGEMDPTGTDEASWQRDRRADVTLGKKRSGIN